MISAMPAVAVRRERKKSRSIRGSNPPPSHHSSITSLSRVTRLSQKKRSNTQSISTISSVQTSRFRRSGEVSCQADRQKLRFLIHVGTVLMVAGLILVFIGVGANVSGTQTVGLLFIGVGSFFCLLKVFCTKSTTPSAAKRSARTAPGDVPPHSLYQVSGSAATTPGSDVNDFAIVNVNRLPPISPVNGQENQGGESSNQTITPTSLNSIPETQVLIPEDKDRY